MKSLEQILINVTLSRVSGSLELELTGIALDSRLVKPGFAFVAVSGTQTDGHDYIEKAIENGAISIIFEESRVETDQRVTWIKVQDSAEALGIISSNWYGNPSRQLTLVAVTGTNGKTTTATLLYQLFQNLGYRVGLLSTVENKIGEEIIPSTHTTPDAISLNELLSKMLAAGCSHVFMEASSHAIHQRRIAGLDFDGAVFSNISHDHLDYHGTFDNYITAKKLLFDNLSPKAFSLVNVDDKRGKVMVQNTAAKIQTYSLQTGANFRGKVLSNTCRNELFYRNSEKKVQ
jgi:UDP-N-acetylmuramoyl-L-alanyl-D-glutamate--2,6-diaminopimelate ligase